MKSWSFRKSWLRKVFRDSKGQTLIEYGLVLILIAVVIVAMVAVIGQKTKNTYSVVGSTMPQPP
jgi:pilus assembly protein Flp/PilA